MPSAKSVGTAFQVNPNPSTSHHLPCCPLISQDCGLFSKLMKGYPRFFFVCLFFALSSEAKVVLSTVEENPSLDCDGVQCPTVLVLDLSHQYHFPFSVPTHLHQGPSWFLNSTVHLLHRLFLCPHINSYINSYPLIWLALYTNFILSRSLSASVTLNL